MLFHYTYISIKQQQVSMDTETKYAVMDCGSGEVRDELPMFLQDGGEEKLNVRRKELEVFVKLLKTAPLSVLQKTQVFLNPCVEGYGDWWRHPDTKRGVKEWLLMNNHKVNGKFGNWSAGFLGSRWADCEINGKNCRFAFYSRKTDAHNFPSETQGVPDRMNYLLSIDPS